MKRIFPLIIVTILFCFLLVFPMQTLEASKTGLLLWFDTVLPTLLPFLILSQLILKTSLVDILQKVSGPAFRRIFHCSDYGVFCFLCGLLCGYPVGARLIALQIKDKNLSIQEGQFLLSFCNNVSPMFCISYGILHAIGTSNILPYLFCIYGSALLFGFFTRPAIPLATGTKKQTSSTESIFQFIDVCIIDSFTILIKLCAYLILFTIISKGLLLFVPERYLYVAPVITSILEITGGLSCISKLPLGCIRSVFAIAAMTFGGLCCIFQTNSVLADTGLSLKKYIFHKVIITILALFLFFLWNFFHNSSFTVNCWS